VRVEVRRTLQRTIGEATLSPGEHNVTLRVRDAPAGAILSGNVEVRFPYVTRAIAVTGAAR
jgi:hypothetical protein